MFRSVCCLLLVSAVSSFAADEIKKTVTNSSEIVVTASRIEKDVQSEPRTVYKTDSAVVTGENAVRTTPEVFKGIPSVMVQKTGYGQGSPYLRGFTGFRTLALIDGIRLNNSVFRDGPNQYWSTIDPLSIAEYELVMGPSSVLYGSDAVGGVMNAITKAPPDAEGRSFTKQEIYYRGSSAERSNTGRAQVSGRAGDNFGFIGGVSVKDYGDLQGGRDVGTQKHTGYDELDWDLRLDYDIARDTTLTYSHQNVEQDDAWRTHKTIYGIDWEGLKKGDDKVNSYDQLRTLDYLKLLTVNMDSFADEMDITFSRHAQEEDNYRVKKDSTSDIQGFDVVTYGASLQLSTLFDDSDLVYGVEYYHDDVNSYARKYKASGALKSVEIQGPVADDSVYDVAGAYVEDTIRLMDDRLEIIPGARYTYAAVEADRFKDPLTGESTSMEDEWNDAVASLRAVYGLDAKKNYAVFAGISQGFRAPNLSDLTRLDSARSNEIETPSPDLDPEHFTSYETGLKMRLDRLAAQLGYYYTAIDSMIIRTPTGSQIEGMDEITKKNSGNGYINGVELTTCYMFSQNWSTWAAGSLMYGKVDSYPSSKAEMQEDYITRLMPPTAQLGLKWNIDDCKYWSELVCDMAADADKLSADDKRDTQRIPPGGTPGYAVVHLRTGTKISESLRLSLALENIFNEDYRIHGSGVNEVGRNFVMTADYVF